MISQDSRPEAISTEDCLRLLRTAVLGRLAVSIHEHPDIYPINYVVDHGRILFRTAEGTKLAAAVLGRGVAFEVDEVDAESGEAWSVVVKGYACEVGRHEEFLDALDVPLVSCYPGRKDRIVRIEPVMITGRRFHFADATGA